MRAGRPREAGPDVLGEAMVRGESPRLTSDRSRETAAPPSDEQLDRLLAETVELARRPLDL